MLYAFGDYEFDTWRHELRLAGTPLHVEPKAFDLLALLIQRHHQFVSREELFTHLWPDQFVSDDALVYCVAEARRAVGDSGRVQRVIKTIRGRGYCFIAPVVARLPGDSLAEATMAATLPFPAQGAAATESLAGGGVERGDGPWQIPPGPGIPGAYCGRGIRPVGVPLFSLLPAQCLVP
jgi:DNA-binding winged helix-turn-helix (wHTH) protein